MNPTFHFNHQGTDHFLYLIASESVAILDDGAIGLKREKTSGFTNHLYAFQSRDLEFTVLLNLSKEVYQLTCDGKTFPGKKDSLPENLGNRGSPSKGTFKHLKPGPRNSLLNENQNLRAYNALHSWLSGRTTASALLAAVLAIIGVLTLLVLVAPLFDSSKEFAVHLLLGNAAIMSIFTGLLVLVRWTLNTSISELPPFIVETPSSAKGKPTSAEVAEHFNAAMPGFLDDLRHQTLRAVRVPPGQDPHIAAHTALLSNAAQRFKKARSLSIAATAKHFGISDEETESLLNPPKATETPAQAQPTPTIQPAPSADPSFRDLPNPTDGKQLAALEAEVEKAIAELAENARLQTVLTAPPWGWNPMEIREQSSAADARRLAFTKIAAIVGRRQKRMMDASYQLRFTDKGTTWDRDFGQPTSVLRIDFHIPGDEVDGAKRWNYGVTVGKSTSTRFLIWEWGQ